MFLSIFYSLNDVISPKKGRDSRNRKILFINSSLDIPYYFYIQGSWIKLDSKNGGSSQTSPKLSDDEGMTEALADAQTEADRRLLRI